MKNRKQQLTQIQVFMRFNLKVKVHKFVENRPNIQTLPCKYIFHHRLGNFMMKFKV